MPHLIFWVLSRIPCNGVCVLGMGRYLSQNQLTDLPADVFASLTALEDLYVLREPFASPRAIARVCNTKKSTVLSSTCY